MGLIEILDGKKVFLDTAPFVYVFENKLPYKDLLVPVFLAIDNGTIHAVSSLVTVIEVLSKPYRFEQWTLVETYRKIFSHSSNIDVLPLTLETADLTAQVRGKYNLKTPDATQWATATLHDVDYFLTNDKGFTILNDDRVLVVDEYI